MDHNTLWFIANGMARPTRPQGPRPYKFVPPPAAPLGPCYNCGENHYKGLSLSKEREATDDGIATFVDEILQ